jgi:hypothetical protein
MLVREVLAARIPVEQLLVLFGREGEVAVNLAAAEAQKELPPWHGIGRCSQQSGLESLPVHLQTFYVNPGLAHDSKNVGTIWLRLLLPLLPPASDDRFRSDSAIKISAIREVLILRRSQG